MSDRPYSGSKANPVAAEQRIKALLKKFGVQMVSITDDYEHETLMVLFKYRNMPAKVPMGYGALAKKWLAEQPYSRRRHKSKADYEVNIKATAYRAAFSVLEDLLKATVTLVDLGFKSFEEVFLADIVMEGEKRVIEIMRPRLMALRERNEG